MYDIGFTKKQNALLKEFLCGFPGVYKNIQKIIRISNIRSGKSETRLFTAFFPNLIFISAKLFVSCFAISQ